MTFHIVSVGWNCADFLEQTLASIEAQTNRDFQVWIVDDATPDPQQVETIRRFVGRADLPRQWHLQVNSSNQGALRNQIEAIRWANPDPGDVIVWLDLDGDQFAHPGVLDRLATAYADGETLLTYGSYRPVPFAKTCTMASEFPPDVIASNSYRRHTLTVTCRWNHLRTMKAELFQAIPDDQFRWPSGPKRGKFYEAGCDYVVMTAALELAGGRHTFIPEVLCLYRHGNPNADNKRHGDTTARCTQNFLRRPPLAPAFGAPPPAPKEITMSDTFLTADERREVLRQIGRQHGLRVFVETGTNDGATPWALMADFDELYTIELGKEAWRAAMARFKGHPKVRCLHGDSAVVLPVVLADLVDQPALIWLDGHFSGGGTAQGPKDTPVLEELEAIFATGVPHVVLVDDARLFGGMSHYGEHDWPHVNEVFRLAEKAGYNAMVIDDIVHLVP